MKEQIQTVAVDAVAQGTEVPWLLVLTILFGSAIVSWAFTEAVKKTAMNKLKVTMTTKEARKSLWWTPMLVVVSMIMGFSVGSSVAAASDWHWWIGGLVGTCGGALASFLVSLFKGNITAMVKRIGGKAAEDNSE